jgi:hypothetical protein
VSRRGAGPFRRDELLGGDGIAPDRFELDAAAAMATQLERVSAEPAPRPSSDFAARVSRAIAHEPLPVPSIAVRESIRHHNAGGFMQALADTVRVAFGPARPAVMRSQAFALLLVALLGIGVLGSATAIAASRFVYNVPAPATQTASTTSATPVLSPSPSPTPTTEDGSPSPEASGSEAPSSTDGGGSGPGTTRPAATSSETEGSTHAPSPGATHTPRPTATSEHPSASPTGWSGH